MIFTQFIRPNGKRKQIVIDMPEDIEEKAKKLIDGRCRFEIEELSTGIINMDCTSPNEETLAIELCQNGPPVVKSVARLVETAYGKWSVK